jgi:hypoxanthine phosphoribosyltransferase
MPETGEGVAKPGGGTFRRIVYDEETIAARVRELGREISEYYAAAENLLLIGILKGAFVFTSDLIRRITRPVQVDFMVAASYGSGTKSSGVVRLLYDPEIPLAGRDVVLVEDVVDSGTTLNRLVPMLRQRGPRSLELCALLHKRLPATLALEPRWVGFDAPDEFLVGYGLDHNEEFRQLPFIASL